MCDDVKALVTEMQEHGIATGPVQDECWGVRTHLVLPVGGKLCIYQPQHARPVPMTA